MYQALPKASEHITKTAETVSDIFSKVLSVRERSTLVSRLFVFYCMLTYSLEQGNGWKWFLREVHSAISGFLFRLFLQSMSC